MDYPDAQKWIALSRRSLTREELDAQQSGDSEIAATADPYVQLAELYNDPALPVRNIACTYESGRKSENMAAPFFHYDGSRVPLSFDGIFERVKAIDPQSYDPRDADWIKSKMREIREVLASCCGPDGFFKSGYQDVQNILTAWSEYHQRKVRVLCTVSR